MSSYSRIKAIAKREFKAYFNSALAYVFLTIFLILGSLLTFKLGGWFDGNEASLRTFFKFHPFIYLIFVPAIGMRVWAEEENQGTLELLLTMPISVWHAVVGKFLAGWFFIGFALLLTFPMVITVCYLGDPDPGRIFSGYLGSFLAGGMFLALTSLTSAFTKNQVISFLFGFTAIIAIVVVGMPQLGIVDYLEGWVPISFIETIAFFSILPHYEGLEKGVLDLRDIVYFLSFISFGLLSSTTILRFRKAAHKNNRLLSFVGIGVFCITLLLVNYLSRGINKRYDLSADKLYTLTQSTRTILKKVEGPVAVRFYYSRTDSSLSIERKAFALRIEDLLKEYSAITNGMISYKILDPKPESVEETSAVVDGIEPIIKQDKTKGYFGISVTYKDNIKTIPVLDESSENMLEYYLTNIFKHLLRPSPPKIGILTDYPILETKANPMAGNYRDKPAWRVIEELRKDYDMRAIGNQLDWGVVNGRNYFDLVVIFNFEPLSNEKRFALDQYLLRGGKVLFCTDSFPANAKKVDKNFNHFKMMPYFGNTLGITESWGVAFKHDKIVVDEKFSTKEKAGMNGANLSLEGDILKSFHPALSKLDKVKLPYAGFFQYKEMPGIEVTPLLTSSKDAYLLDSKKFRQAFSKKPEKYTEVIKAPYALILQVKGKLPSFYRGPSFKLKNKILTSPTAESEVILIGDMDFLENNYAYVQKQEMGKNSEEKVSDNTEMVLNFIDSLATNGDTIDIRMRKEKKRVLELLINKRAENYVKFGDEIDKLRSTYAKSEVVVNELHRRQENQIALTEEELEKFKVAEAELQRVSDRMNALQDKFNQMENQIKQKIVFMNTAVIPFFIILCWLFMTFYRNRRIARQ